MPTTDTRPAPAAPSFASASLARHLARGAIGFGALAGAVVLLPSMWPVSVALLPIALIALRGCPMCWVMGLAQTVTQGRLRRTCTDGTCTLTPGSRKPTETPSPPPTDAREHRRQKASP